MSRRLPVLTATAIALILAAALPALAAKGGGGNSVATIGFAATGDSALRVASPASGSKLSFAVTANVRDKLVDYLWVANECWANGTRVSLEYQPVRDGVSAQFNLVYAPAGATCNAYVFTWPATGTPLSGGEMSYQVS